VPLTFTPLTIGGLAYNIVEAGFAGGQNTIVAHEQLRLAKTLRSRARFPIHFLWSEGQFNLFHHSNSADTRAVVNSGVLRNADPEHRSWPSPPRMLQCAGAGSVMIAMGSHKINVTLGNYTLWRRHSWAWAVRDSSRTFPARAELLAFREFSRQGIVPVASWPIGPVPTGRRGRREKCIDVHAPQLRAHGLKVRSCRSFLLSPLSSWRLGPRVAGPGSPILRPPKKTDVPVGCGRNAN